MQNGIIRTVIYVCEIRKAIHKQAPTMLRRLLKQGLKRYFRVNDSI